MKKILSSRLLILMALAGSFTLGCQSQQSAGSASAVNKVASAEAEGIYQNIEFDMPRVAEPKFNDYSVSIVDFGAVGDGLTKNTKAIADAIDAVAAKGGGRVVIPRGLWLTGPIVLKSNINIHTEKGAMVIFSPDYDDYPLIQTSFEGLNTWRCMSPINGKGLENIAFTGDGVFDGSGGAWRPVKKGKMTESQWKELQRSGGVLSDDSKMWFPSEGAKKGYVMASKTSNNKPAPNTKEELEEIKEFFRPVMVSLVECKKVLLDGPTFQNSPAWNIHPLMCEDITIRNITVRNPWFSQNGDGLDLESCKNALVYNSSFDVGDDAICLKSGKDKDGRDRGTPTENVIVKNNVVYHGHGGFVIGSEMSGGVRNVHVSNCTFMGTDVGLRFKSTRGRGGVVENIWISNIDMINIPTEAIRFNMFYGGKSPILEEGGGSSVETSEEMVPVTEETPSFRNIHMKNITVTGSKTAAFFQGLPEISLKNVSLENAVLEAEKGITMIDSDEIKLKNVTILTEEGPALIIYNSKNVDVNGLAFKNSQEPVVRVLGKKSDNIKLDKSSFNNAEGQVYKGKELKERVVSLN